MNTFDETKHRRQAGGRPDGGRFAETEHAESTVTLDADVAETGDGADAVSVSVSTRYSTIKDRKERVEAMQTDLLAAVDRAASSGNLARWLDMTARNGMNNWSWNNRMLALVQVADRLGAHTLDDMADIPPEKVNVQSAASWKKQGRYPKKGEQGICVLAPCTRKVTEEDPDTGEQTVREVLAGFRGQAKFNVTQTDGDPLPEFPAAPASGDVAPGVLTGLRNRVADAGYGYREQEIPGCRPDTGEGQLGYTQPSTRQVVVDARLSAAQKASTVAHELAHIHCGHVDDYSEYTRHRGRMECEAEAAAYMVNRHLGLPKADAESFSPTYIAAWSGRDPQKVNDALSAATEAYRRIVAGDWPDQDPSGTGPEPGKKEVAA